MTINEPGLGRKVDELCKSFNNNKFSLGVFIDLSKAFDTVDHEILFTKLKHYGIKGNNLKWFKSYLSNRKQFISYAQNKNSEIMQIKCGVPQGSILGPLLFLIYVNDLHLSSNLLQPIMFADDTNLFYSHKDRKTLFKTVNEELVKINNWFRANKLSLNADKTKYTFFHKLASSDHIPLKLPNLTINGTNIKRSYAIKFLGVIIDENITWKYHINEIEQKIAKNLGMLYKASFMLSRECLRNIYFSFIHSHLNYANIAWASTNKNKLRKLYHQQKHASRIILKENKYTHSKPLMKKLNILNVYQLNIFQTLNFMYRTKTKSIPTIFSQSFESIKHKYPTNYSNSNFVIPKQNLTISKFAISQRGPSLWNKFLDDSIKNSESFSCFKQSLKKQLHEYENEMSFFQ